MIEPGVEDSRMGSPWSGRKRAAKRLLDVLGGSLLIIVAAPALATIAVTIRVRDGSPVLFKQQRPGLNEEVFTMFKFRTMRSPLRSEDMLRTDAQRVTKIGAFLRRTSLDELPELINVIRGDMSLVGPRPLLIEYLPKYSDTQRRRHLVRPGITGLAQVSGRRRLTFSQRLKLDVRYVDEWSPMLDIKILLQTLSAPFLRGSDESQAIEEVDDLGFLSKG